MIMPQGLVVEQSILFVACSGSNQIHVLDAQKLISERAISAKVLLVPGTSFMPQQQEGQPSSQVRAAFSTATPEEMDEACRRLAGLLREG